jgi:hypothetical protein|nr:MAG TPA: hypothetical protein [Caudovirales sp. ctNII2]
MKKRDIEEFRSMARQIASKYKRGTDFSKEAEEIEMFLMVRGCESRRKAQEAWRTEAQRQQVALELNLKAQETLAVVAFFEHGKDHTDKDVQNAIRKAKAAGRMIGKNQEEVERDIADECWNR